jgi:hypothetical protein
MDIEIKNTGTDDKSWPKGAGGLIGLYSNDNTNSKVSNSAAVNGKVAAIGQKEKAGRVIGEIYGDGRSASIKNNYALASMEYGASATGTANDIKARPDTGSANDKDGAPKTLNDVKSVETWKALGFREEGTQWDFSSIPTDGYPKFKFE